MINSKSADLIMSNAPSHSQVLLSLIGKGLFRMHLRRVEVLEVISEFCLPQYGFLTTLQDKKVSRAK